MSVLCKNIIILKRFFQNNTVSLILNTKRSYEYHISTCKPEPTSLNLRPIFIPEIRIKLVQEKKGEQKLKSISVLVPLERVQASLSEIGFLLDDTVTIVTDGKFWIKMLYSRGEETISISEEIGDAYPKDPIITICGSSMTISSVVSGIGG
jgi:hypothetical protein